MTPQRKYVLALIGLVVPFGLGLAAIAVAQPNPPENERGQESTPPADAEPTPEPEPEAAPDSQASPPAEPERPQPSPPAPPTDQPPGQPTAEEVLRAFEQDRPKNEPLTPVDVSLATPGGKEDPAAKRPRARYPDGYMLTERAGRITRDGQWYIFSFESSSTAFEEPPVKLLPNLMLERAAFEIQGSPNLVFVVSGEITDFNGENYLLLRKLLRRRDLGNIRK
jgi:hypothetical protein